MELSKFLTDYLKLSSEQIALIEKEDVSNEEIVSISKTIAENNLSLYKNSTEFKEVLANSKKQGFAEGSRKVKKAFANGLNIEVENLDDEDPLNIVSKVKELITVAPNVKDIESKLFEANNKIEELNKIIPTKENEIKAQFQDKYNKLIIGKKRAEILSGKSTIIPTKSIELILTGKEATGDVKFVVGENEEIEVHNQSGRILNEKQNGFISFEDYISNEVTPFISNNNGTPNGVPNGVKAPQNNEPKFSDEYIAELKRYEEMGIKI